MRRRGHKPNTHERRFAEATLAHVVDLVSGEGGDPPTARPSREANLIRLVRVMAAGDPTLTGDEAHRMMSLALLAQPGDLEICRQALNTPPNPEEV